LFSKVLPVAITVRNIIPASSILDALVRFAQALLDEGERCRYRAAFDVLTAASPRVRGVTRGNAIQPESANYRTATAWLASRGLLAPGAVSAKATDDDRAAIEQLTIERAQIER
jgi:hypothetical protein